MKLPKISAKILLLVLSCVIPAVAFSSSEQETVRGHVLFGPIESEVTLLPDGGRSTRMFHYGFGVSDNESAPFHDARFECVTTIITNSDGDMQFEHSMCDITDVDGDQMFIYSAQGLEQSTPLRFHGATGKFSGIEGSISVEPEVATWPDGSIKTPWSLTFSIP